MPITDPQSRAHHIIEMMYDSSKKQKDIIEALEEGEVDFSYIHPGKERTLLASAVEKRKQHIVEHLVKSGVKNDKFYHGHTVLTMMVSIGNLEIARYFSEMFGDIDSQTDAGHTALMYAARQGAFDIVEYLVGQQHANVEKKNNDGYTALMFAAERGHLDVIKYLVDRGAQIDEKNNDGYTALMLAAKLGVFNIVKYFVDSQADINEKDTDRNKALMVAAATGRLDIVKYLVGKQAKIDEKDGKGGTALKYAVKYGRLEVVQYLVAKGAKMDTKSLFPEELKQASVNGHADIARFLISYRLNQSKLARKLTFASLGCNEGVSQKGNQLDKDVLVGIYQDELVKSLIPSNLTYMLHDGLFPKSLFCVDNNVQSQTASPSDTFSVSSEVNGNGEAFQASFAPSRNLLQKNVILDRGSFEKEGMQKIPFSKKVTIVRLLLENGFNVYLCAKNEEGALDFKCLNDVIRGDQGVALESVLQDENLPDFVLDEDVFNKLAKINPSISLDNIAHLDAKQLFAISALSYVNINYVDEYSKKIHHQEDEEPLQSLSQERLEQIENILDGKYAEIARLMGRRLSRKVNVLKKDSDLSQVSTSRQVSTSNQASDLGQGSISNQASYLSQVSASRQVSASNQVSDLSQVSASRQVNTSNQASDLGQVSVSNQANVLRAFLSPLKKNSASRQVSASNQASDVRHHGFNVKAVNQRIHVANNKKKQSIVNTDKKDVSTFQMQDVGQVLNGGSEGLNVRTSVQGYDCTENGKIILHELDEQVSNLSPQSIVSLQDVDIERCKRSQEFTYYQFSENLKANRRTRLFSVSAQESLHGVMGDIQGVVVEKGNDGFFYATVSEDRLLSYVIKNDDLRRKKTAYPLPEDNPIQKIVQDYTNPQKGFLPAMDEDQETPQVENGDVSKWLEDIYETRAGNCEKRVVAVHNKIVTQHPDLKDHVRIVGVNNNHVLLEVRENEDGQWFQYNLGGRASEKNYDNAPSSESENYKYKAEDSWNVPSLVTTPIVVAAAVVSAPFVAAAGLLSNAMEYFEETKEEIEAREALAKEEESKRRQIKKEIEEKVEKSVHSHLQKKTQFDVVEDVYETAQKTKKTLLLHDDTQRNANDLIAKFTHDGKEVFYLHSPQQIFHDRCMKVHERDEVEIYDISLLQESIGHLEGKEAVIIIDWSAFNNKQVLALNTMLDREPRIGGLKIPANTQIVSLINKELHDPSFLSRHNALLAKQGVVAESELEEAQTVLQEIDLEGLVAWREKLFGEVTLNGPELRWDKGVFCQHLEAGKDNFDIKNISEKALEMFKKEVSEARARGYFDYHGYHIACPKNLQVNVVQNACDFSQFEDCKIHAQSKVTNNDNLPEDVKVINAHLFDQLCKRNVIDENGFYAQGSGLIEEKAGDVLNLFITSQLSDEQYYCLFNEALKHDVTLNLFLAKEVALPLNVNANPISTLPARGELAAGRPNVIATNNANEALKEVLAGNDIYAVIDSEDYDYRQLFEGITYETVQNGYRNFKEVKSAFLEQLEEGKKIVLKGEFPKEVLLVLHSILCAQDTKFPQIQDNLTVIVEDKKIKNGQANYRPLDFLGAGALRVQGYDLEKKADRSDLQFVEEGEREENVDLENSASKADEFIQKRKEKMADILQQNPMVQLVGHSGVGKSHLMEELGTQGSQCHVYNELSNFESWANDDSDKVKILFIDESNVEDSHLTMFSPLKRFGHNADHKAKILCNKKFYELDQNHKVVFARNPNNYSAGRVAQKLFDEDVPVMYFKDFPPAYIYETILKAPIYDQLSAGIKSKISEEQFKAESETCIAQYQQFNQERRAEKDDVNCKTVRELQESLLNFINDSQTLESEKNKKIKSKTFISTDATAELEQSLSNFMTIRNRQRNGEFGQEAVGLNGFVISGDAGLGKTELIRSMLESRNITPANASSEDGNQHYHMMEASMPNEEKKAIIIKAFENGDVICCDELNSCIDDGDLEKTLNAALTGKHPGNKKDMQVTPGFMMIASVNSAFWGGRSQLSPAIKHRSVMCNATSLKEYALEDVEVITQHCAQEKLPDLAADYPVDAVTSSIAKSFQGELSSSGGQFLSIRDLNDVIPSVIDEITGDKEPAKNIKPDDAISLMDNDQFLSLMH